MSTPWLKFYPADWRADPALRMCSIAARGLWMEMLCVMHEANPRGVLLVNERPVTERQLAALAGVDLKTTTALLAELAEAGVFSRSDDGAIYSRRMRRDDEKAERDKANGKAGGNPKLKAGVNPPDKPDGSDGITSPRARINQKPEARSQKEETPNPPQPTTSAAPDAAAWQAELEQKCREAAGLENDPSPGLLVIGPMFDLVEAGWSLDGHILPRIRGARAAGRSGRSWSYYAKIVTEGASSPPKAPPPPATNGSLTGPENQQEMVSAWLKKNGVEAA
jgi:hypothetical protein